VNDDDGSRRIDDVTTSMAAVGAARPDTGAVAVTAAPGPADGTSFTDGAPPSSREGWPALPQRRRRLPPWLRMPPPRRPVTPATRWILRIASVAVPLTVWIVLSESGAVDAKFLPSPLDVVAAGWDMLRSGELGTDTWASVRRILLGFGIAAAISIPLGFAMGAFGWAQDLFEPIIGLVRYMPASAFIPLLIIWMGLDEAPKVTLLVIGVVFFNTLMTADVVRRVPRDLLDVSATLGASSGVILRKVMLPYALPGVIDALRVNAAAAWNFVVVAELIAATSGLGYHINQAQRLIRTDEIFAVLIVIGFIGLIIDIGLRILRDRVGRWVP
jgi:NitT/TauT family transport system permease protein